VPALPAFLLRKRVESHARTVDLPKGDLHWIYIAGEPGERTWGLIRIVKIASDLETTPFQLLNGIRSDNLPRNRAVP
jgi:hypothetical protein